MMTDGATREVRELDEDLAVGAPGRASGRTGLAILCTMY